MARGDGPSGSFNNGGVSGHRFIGDLPKVNPVHILGIKGQFYDENNDIQFNYYYADGATGGAKPYSADELITMRKDGLLVDPKSINFANRAAFIAQTATMNADDIDVATRGPMGAALRAGPKSPGAL